MYHVHLAHDCAEHILSGRNVKEIVTIICVSKIYPSQAVRDDVVLPLVFLRDLCMMSFFLMYHEILRCSGGGHCVIDSVDTLPQQLRISLE
jgi:hypothetical protein